MFLGKNKRNVSAFFTVFAMALTVLLAGASVNAQSTRNRLNDFTGNGYTDWTTMDFSTTAGGPITWKVIGNPASPVPNQAFTRRFVYGIVGNGTSVAGDSLTVGDYSGDNKSEVAVYRDSVVNNGSTGTFYVSQFPTGQGGITLERAVPFGNGFTDVPGVQGDYDGDGKDDYAVVRVVGTTASNVLNWYWMSSATGTMRQVTFGTLVGQTGVAIFPGADFTGDGRDEFVLVSRNAAGTIVNYFIGDSQTGAGVITRSFGNYNTDYSIAPDDYTGDGRADFAVSRQSATNGLGVWYIANSQNTTVTGTVFGIADPAFLGDGDVPVRGDFDGDGIHDICVWRPSNQTFYYLSSRNPGVVGGQAAGDETDTPLGSFGLY